MGNGFQRIMPFPALAVLMILCCGCVKSHAAAPLAHEGVIDLSAIDLLDGDPAALDGEWEFYWHQLLTPQDFQNPHPPVMSGYMAFPRAWNRFRLNGRALGSGGYATFRLRIIPSDELHGELALRPTNSGVTTDAADLSPGHLTTGARHPRAAVGARWLDRRSGIRLALRVRPVGE